MGLRGPVRNPNSVRGRREAERASRLAVIDQRQVADTPKLKLSPIAVPHDGELPCPQWLTKNQGKLFRDIAAKLHEAKVPVEAVDTYAIAQAAVCQAAVEESSLLLADQNLEPSMRINAWKILSQMSKELRQWLPLICATTGSRVRIGLKVAPDKKMGPLAQLLAAKQSRQA